MILTVYCEFCKEAIAKIDTEKITYPWKPEDFQSVDPRHNARPPFQPGTPWEMCKCPCGPHRPFMYPERLKTDKGYFNIPSRTFIDADKASDSDQMDKETHDRAKSLSDMTLKDMQASITIPKPKKEQFFCIYCGREVGSKAALVSHERACERKLRGKHGR